MAPPLDVTLSRGVLLPLGPPATRGELFSIDTFGIVGVMTRGDDPGAEAPPPPAPAPEPEPAMAAAKLAAAETSAAEAPAVSLANAGHRTCRL